MGFLQAVGESNLLGTVAGGIKGMAAMQEMETSKQQMALTQIQMREAMEKEKLGNTLIPYDAFLAGLNNTDLKSNRGKTVDKFMEPFKVKGPGGIIGIPAKSAPIAFGIMATGEGARSIGLSELSDLTLARDEAKNNLDEAIKKGNKDKIQEAQGIFNQSELARSGLYDKVHKLEERRKEYVEIYGPTQADAIFNGTLNPKDAKSLKVIEKEATPVKPLRALKTIYGPGGQTAEVEATAGYVPPKGWSLKAPFKEPSGEKGKVTEKELLQLKKDKLKYVQKGIADFKAANPLGKITPETIDTERKRLSEEYDAGMGTQPSKPAPIVSKGRDIKPLSSYFKGAKTKDSAIAMIKEADGKGWTVEELKQAEKEAKWAW
jgi:hypothetical protein